MSRLYTEAEVRDLVGKAKAEAKAEVDRLVAEAVAPLLVRIAELEAEVARLKKNSSNSSKPPSSDIVKPRKKENKAKKRRGKRSKGAQPGHERHEREGFSEEDVDYYMEYELELDKKEWEPLDQWEVVQQAELRESPIEVVEHRARLYRHRTTKTIRRTGLPAEVKAGGLTGPRLTAFLGYLKGHSHMSYTTIQTLLQDVYGLSLSVGQIAKVVTEKVSNALETPYTELRDALPQEPTIGVDETGHKDNGKLHWTWCFRAATFVFFHISPSRASTVLRDILGDFAGTMHCDYFSAYRKYMKDAPVLIQFCLAHLIREVKFLSEQKDKVTKNWADKILDRFRKMFRLIHDRESYSERRFQRKLEKLRDDLIARFKRAPDRPGARNMRKRFKDHANEFFTFVTTPGAQPTNNMTEQALRYVVIDRKITQGTRSAKGQRWCERIWTAISTCRRQNRSVFAFLVDAVSARFHKRPAPSLLTNPDFP